MKIRLHEIAHCRAGDKGNTSTLSVIAYDEAMYPPVPEHPGRSGAVRDAECRRPAVHLPSSPA